MTKKPRRTSSAKRIAFVAVLVALATATGVFAYFKSSGSGTASARVGTLSPATISAPGSVNTPSVTITWTQQAAMTPSSADSGIAYTVERKLNSGSFTALASGGCSVALGYPTASCIDTLPNTPTTGTYSYRVIAHYHSWSATSNTVDLSANLDSTAPTTSISFPTAGFLSAAQYGGGCSTTGICGTASDQTGVSVVRVSAQRGSDGLWWNGSSFVSSGSELFNNATLSSPGGTSTGWSLPLPLPADGGYTIDVQAKDTVGNDSSPSYTSTRSFSIDTTAPLTSLSTAPASPDGSNNWFQRSSVSFTLSATDTGSGVATSYYTVDGGGQHVYSSPVSISSQGDHTVTYWSVDNLGNLETTHSAHIKLDNVKPSTTIAVTPTSPDGSSGWRVSATSFTLAASDATSGVASTHYQVDGGADTLYTGSAVSIPEGSHTVSYWSVDNAGNVESTHTTAAIKIDTVKPSTTITLNPASPSGSNGWYKGTAPTFTFSASDASSGVATTHYKIDGGADTLYTGSAVSIPEGTHTVSYWSVDNAGNVESTHTTATIKVDTVKPTDSVGLGASSSHAFLNGSTLYYKGNAAGSFSLVDAVTDATSGAASATFPALNSGGWTGAGGTVTTPSGGPYSSSYFWAAGQTLSPTAGSVSSVDTAGNTSTGAILTLSDDTTGPAVSITAPSTGNINGNVSLTSTATDTGGSGVTSVTYYWCNTTCSGTPITAPANWNLISTANSGPTWSGSWDSTAVKNSNYTLEAVGTDNVGNQAASTGVAVTTANYSFTVSNPGSTNSVTAGSADTNAITIQLQLNGANTGTMAGSSYGGNHTITFSGSAMNAAPDGTTGTPASQSVSFNTSGTATIPASTFTFYLAVASAALTATDTGNTIAGTSGSFAINAGAAVNYAWTAVTKTAGTLNSPCLFTCTDTALSNNQSITASVSITDSHGNIVSGIGTGHTATITITQNQSGGAFTSPTATSSPVTLSFPAAGAATTTGSFTYRASNTGNWIDKLTATTPAAQAPPTYGTANMTVTKQ